MLMPPQSFALLLSNIKTNNASLLSSIYRNVNALPCFFLFLFFPDHKSSDDLWSRDTFSPTADKHDPLGSVKALNEFFILRALHSIRS